MLLDDPLWTSELRGVAAKLPKPKAILIVSAHWESEPVTLSSPEANTPLIYDFGGFDPKFYRMTYETPEATWLSEQVSKLMPDNEHVVHASRGLDHGAWVPLNRRIEPATFAGCVEMVYWSWKPNNPLVTI